VARATYSPAALAQAINSTSPTAPNSTSKAERTFSTPSTFSGSTRNARSAAPMRWRHHACVGARLRERDARRQTCHGLEGVQLAVELDLRMGAQRLAQRHPQLGILVGNAKPRGMTPTM